MRRSCSFPESPLAPYVPWHRHRCLNPCSTEPGREIRKLLLLFAVWSGLLGCWLPTFPHVVQPRSIPWSRCATNKERSDRITARHSVRDAPAAKESWILNRRGDHSCSGNWLKHGDLQQRQRTSPAPVRHPRVEPRGGCLGDGSEAGREQRQSSSGKLPRLDSAKRIVRASRCHSGLGR